MLHFGNEFRFADNIFGRVDVDLLGLGVRFGVGNALRKVLFRRLLEGGPVRRSDGTCDADDAVFIDAEGVFAALVDAQALHLVCDDIER